MTFRPATLSSSSSRNGLHIAGYSVSIWLAVVFVAAVSLWFRCWLVSNGFYLTRDQFDHWSIASRAFRDVPLHGTPRMDCGWSYGPIYYDILWVFYHLTDWWSDPLPHYAGLAIGLGHVAAEVIFFLSLLRARMSLPWALGVSLALASSAPEASLSHTLWNPNVAAIFFYLALAALISVTIDGSRRATIACLVCCVFTVHCHTPTLFFAGPVAASACLLRLWRLRERRFIAKEIALGLAIVCLLQVPYLFSDTSSRAASTLSTTLSSPLSAIMNIHWLRGGLFVNKALTVMLAWPLTPALAGPLFLCAFALLVMQAWRRQSVHRPLAATLTVGTILTWIGWSLYPNDDLANYWLCGTQAAFALGVGFAYANTQVFLQRPVLAWVFPLAIAATLPFRFADSSVMDRLPEYERLVNVACSAAKQHAPVPNEAKFQSQLDFLYGLCRHQGAVPAPPRLTPEHCN